MVSLKDLLTVGDVRRLARQSWEVSWPMTLIMFFEFLIGLTDVYIAGRMGKEIQAAYGFVVQFYFIFIIIVNALTAGTVAVVSRLFTTRDNKRLSEAVFSTIITTVVCGIFFAAAGALLTPQMIGMLNIPDALKPIAVPLGRIYALGVLFHYLLINTNGILRACKSVKRSLATMAVVCTVNVGFAFLLVYATPLGYLGIAFATATAVCVGSMINLWRMRVFIGPQRIFSAQIIKRIASIGWPAGAGQVSWQIHSMVLFLILSTIPGKSIEVLAAFAAGLRVESAIFLPAMAFNMGCAVIVGNLLGEGKKEEAFKAGIVTALMGVAIITLLTLAVIGNARWIMPILSHDSIVIGEGIRYLYISMLSEPFMAFWLILGGGLMGAGDTRGVMANVVVATWLVRIPMGYTFVALLGFGPGAVWWALNASQFLCAVLIARRYLQKKWLAGPG
jgi:multidrug resistance protein, MATE family